MSAARAPRAREVATASVPGRICLAGESLDWMTGGNSVTAAVPLRTRVTAWRADGSDALALISGPPLYQNRLVPAARAAASVYDRDVLVLDHMQAAATITPPAAGELAGVVVTASTDLPVGAGVSSSAALTLAVVTALSALRTGEVPEAVAACTLARQAETAELGTGAGWMDFLACASGGVCQVTAGSAPRLRGRDHRARGGAVRAAAQPGPGLPRGRDAAERRACLLRDLVACSTPLIDACAGRERQCSCITAQPAVTDRRREGKWAHGVPRAHLAPPWRRWLTGSVSLRTSHSCTSRYCNALACHRSGR